MSMVVRVEGSMVNELGDRQKKRATAEAVTLRARYCLGYSSISSGSIACIVSGLYLTFLGDSSATASKLLRCS